MSRVLVTGGAGFIGSHLVDALVRQRHRVLVIDDLSVGKREYVNPRAHFTRKQIQHPGIGSLVGKFRPDTIYHLAAQKNLQVSKTNPAVDAETNIIGSLRLIQAAQQHRVRRFVFYSTAAVYDPDAIPPNREDDLVRPVTPYGIAKRAVEQYLEHSGIGYAILRLANVYGPRQDAAGEGGVVAIFCSQLAQHRRSIINNTGRQTRDFIYVSDVVRASCAAAARRTSLTVNISTGCETPIRDLYRLVAQLAGDDRPAKRGRIIPEQYRSAMDFGRGRRLLGWQPRILLSQGIQQTYQWFISK